MLRIDFMQNGFGLSDPGMEDALYEIESMHIHGEVLLGVKPLSVSPMS